jgi:hypothetical protein
MKSMSTSEDSVQLVKLWNLGRDGQTDRYVQKDGHMK